MRPTQQVLVVEDDTPTRQALRVLLEAAGYRVALAINGREALDWLHRGGPPLAVLPDLNMPVLDGWQFLRERGRNPALVRIPVLVVSGETDLPQVAASLGVAACLPKPVEFDQLLQVLCSLGGGGPQALLAG